MRNQSNDRPQMASNILSDRSTLVSTSEPAAAVILQLADGTIAACNPATVEILGYTAEELIGKNPADLPWQTIHPDGSAFLPADYPAIAACQTGQPGINIPMGFYRPPGDLVWLKLDSQPLFRGGESAPYAIVTTISEIGEPNHQSALKEPESPAALDDRQPVRAIGTEVDRRLVAAWESMTDAYTMLDRDWRIIYANSASIEVLCRLTNLAPDAILGKSHWEILPSLVGQEVEREYRRAVAERVAVHLEVFYQPTGNWFEAHAYPLDAGLGIYFRNITKRKQTEAALQESESRYRTLFETMNQGFCICQMLLDENGQPCDYRFLEVNRVFEQMTGLVQPTGKTARELVPDLEPHWFEIYGRVALTREPVRFENQSVVMNRWFEVRAFPIGEPQSYKFAILFTNITDRKQAEERLRQSEEQFSSIVNQATTGIVQADLTGQIVLVNQQFCQIVGYSKAELLQMRMHDITHPDDLPRSLELFDRLVTEGREFQIEKRYCHKDGSVVWVNNSVSVLRDVEGRPYSAIAVVLDVSARKQAEAALQESEARFRQIAETIEDVFWISNPWERQIYYLSPAYERIWGRDRERAYADYQSWAESIHPDDRLPSRTAFFQQIQAGNFEAEYRIVRPDGSIRWIYDRGFAVKDEFGNFKQLVGIAEDITDRKQAELEMQKFISLVENSGDFIGFASLDGRPLFINAAGRKLVGLEGIDSLQHVRIRDFFFPEDWNFAEREQIPTALATGQWFGEDRWRHFQTGEAIAVECNLFPIRDPNTNEPVAIATVTRDIRERQRIEAALRESEERLRLALWGAGQGTWDLNLKTEMITWDDRCKEIFGLLPDSPITYKWHLDLLHPDDRQRVIDSTTAALRERTEFKEEYRTFHPDGTMRWVLARGRGYYNEAGEPYRMSGTVLDISDRKLAEESLRQSEEFKNRMLESSPDCIKVLDLDGRLIYMNAGGMCLMEIDELTPYLNAEWVCFWEGEYRQKAEAALARAKSGEVAVFEGYCPTAKGTPKWWNVIVGPILDGTGQVERVLAISRDISDRQQAEAALHQSQAIVRQQLLEIEATYQTAPIGLCVLDPNLRYQRINQRLAEINGVAVEDHIGRTVREVVPDLADEIEPLFYQILATGEPLLNLEISGETAAQPGVRRTWLGNYFPLKDASDRIIGINVVAQEITDRKQTEIALRESEERLRLALTAANQGLYDLNLQTGEAIVSPQYALMLGYDPLEFEETNAKWRERLHPDDRERVSQVYEDYIAGRRDRYQVEFRQRTKLGDWKWILSTGSIVECDECGEPLRMLGIHTDISDRKQAEISLRESEERYRYLVESIPQLVWTANREGVLLDVNQRWIDYTGVTLAQAFIDGWQTVVHPEDAPAMGDRWVQAQTAGSHYQAEGRMRRADGTYRWHLHQAMPLKDDRGQIVKWFGSATDIHDRVELEFQRDLLLKQEREARAESERANRLKDEFLAAVSHELRTPLNPILGWVQILQRSKFNETRLVEGLGAIERNAKQQSQLIEDLLDISRAMRGKLTLKSMPLGLAPVISAALETVRLAAEAKNLQIDALLDSNVGRVMGDAGRLQQVMWNLLSNAVKFTPKGGRVEVRLERVEGEREEGEEGEERGDAGRIINSTLNTQHSTLPTAFAQISVADTGKGISAEFLPYVFDRFRQEDGSTTRQFGGLGLGMSIARQIVQMHGGTIWVESPGEGRGATFFVRLPLLPEATAPQPKLEMPASDSSDSLPLAGVRVLAVDDDDDNLQFLKLLLQENGAIAIPAASASEALAIVRQSMPDILLSDIGMPEMDGYGLLAAIRALSSEGAIVPAIAVTAYAQEIDRQRALAVGFQEHLAKPIEPELLVAKIKAAIENARHSGS